MNQKPLAIVSGATRGIGLAVAQSLVKKGFAVATFARSAEGVDTFSGKMEEAGGFGMALKGDARDDAFLQEFVKVANARLGEAHVLVNNAGGGKKGAVSEALVEDWDFILQTNLRANMMLTKLVLPQIVSQKNGAVIFIASIAGKIGMAESSAYCASKFGILGFAESLFEEVRDTGTKVSSICPGYVDTPLIPFRKNLLREEMIRAEDVARAVEYVLDSSPSACPTEIVIRPQKNPFRK